MKIKSLVECLDIHKGEIYPVIASGEGWVKIIDSIGDEFTLINDEDYMPLEYEVVEQ